MYFEYANLLSLCRLILSNSEHMYSGECQTSEKVRTEKPVFSDQTLPLKAVMKEPCAFEVTFSNATLFNRNDTLMSFYELIPYLTIHISNTVITSEKPKQLIQ